jgi:PBSX family phage terminase large subunit
MAWKHFSAKQLAVINAPIDRYILLADGAVRSGKTVAMYVKWIAFVKAMPKGAKFLMTGRTRDTLKNNVLDPMLKLVPRSAWRYNRQTGELWLYGRQIRCVGASDESAQDAIQGDTVCGWLADEIALYPKSFVDQAKARCSDDPGFMLWNCNPQGPFHYIHAEYIDPEGESVKADLVRRLHFTLDDNLALSEAYKRQLRASKGLWYKRNVLGLWVLAEGIIYDVFDLDKHGFGPADMPSAFDRYSLTIDHGTANPLHAILLGHAGGVDYALREYRYSGREAQASKTNGEYAIALREWLDGIKPRDVFIDPAAAAFVVEMQRKGFNVTKALNDVSPGIHVVSQRLVDAKLKISREGCPQLIKELGTYAWDPKKQKVGEDVPIKVNDHGPDALRYYVYTRYGKGSDAPVGLSTVKGRR